MKRLGEWFQEICEYCGLKDYEGTGAEAIAAELLSEHHPVGVVARADFEWDFHPNEPLEVLQKNFPDFVDDIEEKIVELLNVNVLLEGDRGKPVDQASERELLDRRRALRPVVAFFEQFYESNAKRGSLAGRVYETTLVNLREQPGLLTDAEVSLYEVGRVRVGGGVGVGVGVGTGGTFIGTNDDGSMVGTTDAGIGTAAPGGDGARAADEDAPEPVAASPGAVTSRLSKVS